MGTMREDYDHLLNLDYDRDYKIPLTTAESLITTAGRTTEKLDGIWNFAPDVYDTFIRKKFFEEIYHDEQGRDKPVDCDFDHWENVLVPSNWNLQNPTYWFFEGSGIYSRKFRYFAQKEAEQVFLRIGAANYETRVWLNGKQLARHEGGFTPFMVDLTEHIKAENRLLIMVNNQRKLEQIPSINYDWFNYGGLYRSVEMIRLPRGYIQDCYVRLVPDDRFDTIEITVQTTGIKPGEIAEVSIPELGVKECLPIDGAGKCEFQIKAKPILWSIKNPHVYPVFVRCGEDQIEEAVGFRQVKVEGKDIYLNGERLFLKGVCCHEESMERGRALTEEDQLQVLRTAKEMDCNIIRLSHYPHSERMAKLADRLGMLLWEEIPVYWALCFDREETFLDAQNQLRELILRDRNRASVIMWGIGNENPDTDERLAFMKKLAQECKTLDPTRLTVAACLVNIDEMKIMDRLCQEIDVVAINEYYGWYYRNYDGLREIFENSAMDRPVVISETGADGVAGHFGDEEELFTENHQAKMYRKQFEIAEPYIAGIFPWILFDFRSPVRLNPLQGSFNRKGLLGSNRTDKKMAYHIVKAFYQTK